MASPAGGSGAHSVDKWSAIRGRRRRRGRGGAAVFRRGAAAVFRRATGELSAAAAALARVAAQHNHVRIAARSEPGTMGILVRGPWDFFGLFGGLGSAPGALESHLGHRGLHLSTRCAPLPPAGEAIYKSLTGSPRQQRRPL